MLSFQQVTTRQMYFSSSLRNGHEHIFPVITPHPPRLSEWPIDGRHQGQQVLTHSTILSMPGMVRRYSGWKPMPPPEDVVVVVLVSYVVGIVSGVDMVKDGSRCSHSQGHGVWRETRFRIETRPQ